MTERNEILSVLDNLRGRTARTDLLQGVTGTIQDRLTRFVRRSRHELEGTPYPTPTRSEVFVSPDKLPTLHQAIQTAREIIFAKGRPITEDPFYAEAAKHDIKEAAVLARRRTVDNKEGGLATASLELLDPDRDVVLSLIKSEIDTGNIVDIGFYPGNKFDLEIDFEGEGTGKRGLTYEVPETPLEEMTEEEYRVISYYINRY